MRSVSDALVLRPSNGVSRVSYHCSKRSSIFRMAAFMSKMPFIDTLDLAHNRVGPEGGAVLTGALPDCNLKLLDISQNHERIKKQKTPKDSDGEIANTKTVTPRGVVFHTQLGREILGTEKLRLQGILSKSAIARLNSMEVLCASCDVKRLAY